MTDKSAGQALAVRRRSVSYLFKGVFGFGVLCVSGKIKQYFDSTNLTLELKYKVDGGMLVTKTPDGKETTWTAAPNATSKPRSDRLEGLGRRILHFFGR